MVQVETLRFFNSNPNPDAEDPGLRWTEFGGIGVRYRWLTWRADCQVIHNHDEPDEYLSLPRGMGPAVHLGAHARVIAGQARMRAQIP